MARRAVSNGELYMAMASLPEVEKLIVDRFYGFGQSPSSDSQIGEELAMDRQAVQRRRQLALGKLRQILEASDV